MAHRGFKDAVIQSILLNIIFFAGFSWATVTYAIPSFLSMEEKKEELQEVVKSYEGLTTKGISFSHFKKIYDPSTHKEKISISKEQDPKEKKKKPTVNKKDLFMTTILSEMTAEDYGDYFENTTKKTYGDFLDISISKISKKQEVIVKKGNNKAVKELLPSYIEKGVYSNDQLTDFIFINQMEGLLHAFNLYIQPDTPIGIGDVFNVDETKNTQKRNKKIKVELDGDIYYFEQNLSFVGKKKDIINFIYYIENVAKIGTKGDDISIYTMEKRGDFSDLNEYEENLKKLRRSFLMEISKVTFEQYLDSSELATPDGKSSIKFIKEDQGNERYSAEIFLKIYVQGLPSYKRTDYILKTSNQYFLLQKIVLDGIKTTSTQRKHRELLKKLKRIQVYLSGISKEITLLKNGASSGESEELYKKAHIYKKIFSSISKDLLQDFKGKSEVLYKKYKLILEK